MLDKLENNGHIKDSELQAAFGEAAAAGKPVDRVLQDEGIPKCEVLQSLAGHYDCPFIEYDEDLMISHEIMSRIDADRLKQELWVPLSIVGERAEVIANKPGDPELVADIRRSLGVRRVDFRFALAEDIVRIIENNQDINPGFPAAAGRTPLALTRTYLAGTRSSLALQRTALAKGRTGLAFLRTGIACITIAVTFIRLFGLRYMLPLDVLLVIGGTIAVVDGLWWYLPARREAARQIGYESPDAGDGLTVLATVKEKQEPRFVRTGRIAGARALRRGWNLLSPVMRRRFLANDRTELAEERTEFASLRNNMAKTRTGLALARSGIAFAGLGIGLMTKFPSASWVYFDVALIAAGVLMTLDGFHWYLPGYSAGREGLARFKRSLGEGSIWEMTFGPVDGGHRPLPPVSASHAPGIWGTTGLALERTVLAERRNVMARLRTVMAYSRTGFAFVRTGMSIASVAVALLVALASSGTLPRAAVVVLLIAGLALVADGARWCLASESVRKGFPYTGGEIEISIPNYGVPSRYWGSVVFSDQF